MGGEDLDAHKRSMNLPSTIGHSGSHNLAVGYFLVPAGLESTGYNRSRKRVDFSWQDYSPFSASLGYWWLNVLKKSISFLLIKQQIMRHVVLTD